MSVSSFVSIKMIQTNSTASMIYLECSIIWKNSPTWKIEHEDKSSVIQDMTQAASVQIK